MSHDEEETREFFDQLSGNPPADGSPPNAGIVMLREALRSEIDTLRAAESATEADLTAEERAHMDAIKQHLVDRGLLGAPVTKSPHRIHDQPTLMQRLAEFLVGSGWHRPVAVAAGLMLAALVVLKIALPPPAEENIMRGAATPVMMTADPASAAEALAVQLRGVGADVLVVQINATMWSMRIDVPATVNPAAIQEILNARGVHVSGPPPYEIKVTKER